MTWHAGVSCIVINKVAAIGDRIEVEVAGVSDRGVDHEGTSISQKDLR